LNAAVMRVQIVRNVGRSLRQCEGVIAPLMSRDFKVVKINVGKSDSAYDVVCVTKAGEIADARNLGDQGIYDSF
jgi:hypothetical protein